MKLDTKASESQENIEKSEKNLGNKAIKSSRQSSRESIRKETQKQL